MQEYFFRLIFFTATLSKQFVFTAAFFFLASGLEARIELIPVTLQEAKDSQVSDFSSREAMATEAGLTLTNYLHNYSVSGHKNGKAFLLFYNHASAPDCGRAYLLQRVKLTKMTFDASGQETSRKEQYLVEVMKTKAGKGKKPDEHLKLYSLGQAERRHLSAEYEIGCGEIPGMLQGSDWPYESNKLYRLIQDYSESPGLYFQIRFDDSATYRFDMNHDAQGVFHLTLPSFVPKGQ